MSEQLKYCMGCMQSIPYDAVICPKCGHNEETLQSAPYLEIGSLIMRKYLTGKVIAVTPDTITYIGANIETGRIVDVVEFFPHSIVTRKEGESAPTVKLGYDSMFSGCLQSFLNLWRGLDVFKDSSCLPNVVDIVDYNSTVYAICEHKDCITLLDYFKGSGSPLSWTRAISAFRPVMFALKKLNFAGIVHGGLSPETILVGSDGKLHITGFSIPQCHSGLIEFSNKPAPGFAPLELYDTSGSNANTDIYSVTALIYYSITLITPPEATLRVVKDTLSLPASVANTLSRSAIDGLIRGLAVHKERRFCGFDELITALSPTKAPAQQAPVKQAVPETAYRKPLTQKEEIDLEIENEQRIEKELKKEKKDSASAIGLGLKAFLAGFVVCAIAFCGFYATVLYKNYPIDFMDKLLKPFVFLPLNSEPETTAPTTSIPVPTEPNYITVADFVGNHTYDSVLSNSFFTENYKFNFLFEESVTIPKNAIISQSLEPGESVLAGSEITLVISLGTTKVKLPDVVGVNYLIAAKTLDTAGFKVKYELLTNDGKHTVGEVFSIDKKVGELYEEGTVITLSVWGKIAATTVPSTTASSSSQTTTKKPVTTTNPTTESTTVG